MKTSIYYNETIIDRPEVSGIYRIINIQNQKSYIGSSINIHNRIIDHLSRLNRQKHRNFDLQQDMNKYGIGSFSVEILELNDNAMVLCNLESKWQKHFINTYNVIKTVDIIELSESDKSRFWSKVNKNTDNGCWLWSGKLNFSGYGTFQYQKLSMPAHRLSYFLEYGKFDYNNPICHKCNNRGCVNPGHLYVGSYQDNARDVIIDGTHSSARVNYELADKIRKEHKRLGGLPAINIKGWLLKTYGIDVSVHVIRGILANRTYYDKSYDVTNLYDINIRSKIKSKLNWDIITEIRNLYETKQYSNAKIAAIISDKYGILPSPSNIWRIVKYNTWNN